MQPSLSKCVCPLAYVLNPCVACYAEDNGIDERIVVHIYSKTTRLPYVSMRLYNSNQHSQYLSEVSFTDKPGRNDLTLAWLAPVGLEVASPSK